MIPLKHFIQNTGKHIMSGSNEFPPDNNFQNYSFPQSDSNNFYNVNPNVSINYFKPSPAEKLNSDEDSKQIEEHNQYQPNNISKLNNSYVVRPDKTSFSQETPTPNTHNGSLSQNTQHFQHLPNIRQPHNFQQIQYLQQYQNERQFSQTYGFQNGKHEYENQEYPQDVTPQQMNSLNQLSSGTSIFPLQNQSQNLFNPNLSLNQGKVQNQYQNDNYNINQNQIQQNQIQFQNMVSYMNGPNITGAAGMGMMPPIYMSMAQPQQPQQYQQQQQQYDTQQNYNNDKNRTQSLDEQEVQQHETSMAEYLYAKGDMSSVPTSRGDNIDSLDQENKTSNETDDLLNFDGSKRYLNQMQQQQYQQFHQLQQLQQFQQFQQLRQFQQLQLSQQLYSNLDVNSNTGSDSFNTVYQYSKPSNIQDTETYQNTRYNDASEQTRKLDAPNPTPPTSTTGSNTNQKPAYSAKDMTADNISRANSVSSLLLSNEMLNFNNFAGMFQPNGNMVFTDNQNGTLLNHTLGSSNIPATGTSTFTTSLPKIRKTRRQIVAKSKDTSNDPANPKRYRCAHCTWSFTRQSDLRRHLKSHNKPQYHCPFFSFKYHTCSHKTDGSFNRLDVLKRHLKLVHFNPDQNPKDLSLEADEKTKKKRFDSGTCLSCSVHFDDVKAFILHVPECAENTPMKIWKYKRNGDILSVRKHENTDELKLREKSISEDMYLSTEDSYPVTVNAPLENISKSSVATVSVNDIEEKPEEMKEALSRRRGRPRKTYK